MGSDRLWVVTGATGFVGGAVVRELAQRGERTRAVWRRRSRLEALPIAEFGGVIEEAQAELGDVAALTRAFTGAPGEEVVVVHAAALVSIYREGEPGLARTNVEGTRHVVEACRAAGVRRLVYVSSMEAIEPPPEGVPLREPARFSADLVWGPYAKTKAEATRLVLTASGLDTVAVLPTGVLGPGPGTGNHTRELVRALASGEVPALLPGGFDIVDVRDVAKGVVLAAEKGRSGQAYLLSGEFASLTRLARLVKGVVGVRVPPTIPALVAQLAAPVSEVVYKVAGRAPLLTRYSLRVLANSREVSSDRAWSELGYVSRPLAETVRDTIDWLVQNEGTVLRVRHSQENRPRS